MCSRFLKWSVSFVLALSVPLTADKPAVHELRICADANNLPFSNQKRQGFEDRIATLLAHDLGAEPAYLYWRQSERFLRNTLLAKRCDLVMGLPQGADKVLTTDPYYRSQYVFVYRKGSAIFRTYDDVRLRKARIGLPLIDDDGFPPPYFALKQRGLEKNITWFPLLGNYSTPAPPSRLIEAVAKGKIDVAIAWGPTAGYFAAKQPVQLAIAPATAGVGGVPSEFAITMAVRREDAGLRDRLNTLLRREQPRINKILDEYNVPRARSAATVGGETRGGQ